MQLMSHIKITRKIRGERNEAREERDAARLVVAKQADQLAELQARFNESIRLNIEALNVIANLHVAALAAAEEQRHAEVMTYQLG